MPADRLRVHVENDPNASERLHVSRALFDTVFADIRDRLSVSFNNDPAQFAATAADAEVLFTTRKIDGAGQLARLKWVQSISAGVDGILPYLPDGVILTNASGVHADKAAEFILTSVLMLNYGIPRFVSDQQHRRWLPSFGGTVRGKAATMVGVGSIGGPAARLLKSLGLRTQAISRLGGAREGIDVSVTFSEMDSLLPTSDFLISSAPLTPQTEGMIGRAQLDRLPAHAGVVIVGRAKVFDCDALVAKLHEGSLAGVVLDVFPIEPLPEGHPIWTTPNLIMTPHCSVDDHNVYLDRCLDIFRDNLLRYLDGKPLRNLVDPTLGY